LWSAGVIRSHNSPRRIIPHLGKVTEDDGKSSSHKQRAVFHEDEARAYFADNARHLTPEPGPGSGDPGSFPGCGNVLARESARNHVNNSSPWSSVKCTDIVPNRERGKHTIVLTCEQN